MISLDFDRSSSLANQQASAPSQSGFPKKNWYRWADGAPSALGFFQALEFPVHAVPIRCDRDQELLYRGAQPVFGVTVKRKYKEQNNQASHQIVQICVKLQRWQVTSFCRPGHSTPKGASGELSRLRLRRPSEMSRPTFDEIG
jgi:hypothetical protein